MRVGFAALVLLVGLAGCAPRPTAAPAAVIEPPKPAPLPSAPALPPASPEASLMEASCVRMGSVPMVACRCWSRTVVAEIDPKVAAAYGIQNVARRADAMTALKPDLMKTFLAASERAEAACAGKPG